MAQAGETPGIADEGSRQPFALEPLMRRNLACRRPARGAACAERGCLPYWGD